MQSRVKVILDSGKEHELWLEANVELDTNSDCWLFLLLPIGMGLAETIEITGELTQTAIESFYSAQDALLEKHPHLARIELQHKGELVNVEHRSDRKVASFFSGGLDSAYTAEKIKEITTLIAVWGFDIQVWNEKHWNLSSTLLEEHVKELGKELIYVKTNIREISNGLLSWGRDFHGSALAGVANSLAGQLETVYISSTHSEDTNRWGQFPLLSRSFCTNYQQIVEYGPEVRTAKALALKDIPSSVYVRVCYRNITGKANCGKCQKCIRTRLEFGLVNAKFRPLGLETKPGFKTLLKLRIEGNDYNFFKDSLGYAREKNFKGTLLPTLAVSIARARSILYFKYINPKKSKDFNKPPSSRPSTTSN